jgi:hypothetical protein
LKGFNPLERIGFEDREDSILMKGLALRIERIQSFERIDFED